jgi:hypothetical protein
VPSRGFRRLVCVGDCDTLSCNLERRHVVGRVTDRETLSGFDTEVSTEQFECAALALLWRFDVIRVACVDHSEAVFVGDFLKRFERRLTTHRNFGLAPAIHEVRLAPAEAVACLAVLFDDCCGGLAVSGVPDWSVAASQRDAAVLGDDDHVEAEKLTECDRIRHRLSRGDDDRCGPVPEHWHHTWVQRSPVVGQRPVDVGDQRPQRLRQPRRQFRRLLKIHTRSWPGLTFFVSARSGEGTLASL